MKLRTRLWIGFATVLFIPIILITLASSAMLNYQQAAIEEVYGVTLSDDFLASAPVQLVGKRAAQIQQQIHTLLKSDAEQFQNQQFLQVLDKSLVEKGFHLVVRAENEVIYAAPDIADMLPYLPEYGETQEENTSILIGDEQRVVKQLDFAFEEGRIPGTVFLIADGSVGVPEIKEAFIEIVILIILILILTAVILTGWIYYSIVHPLAELKVAANKIKEGNLDFTISGDEQDEIGQLRIAFEEMRRRLQDSAEAGLAHDAESKELISNISHDLKTPITAIKGYVEGIRDGVADTPEKMERYIGTIYNKANDMDRLIDELTFYSRIDTNRIPYNFAKINVAGYFEDCAEELNMELAAKSVEFNYSNYCDNSIQVIADSEQIRRVINNIVSNSIKYFDKPQGKIHMRVLDVGDFIQVEIEDNGKGIAQKDLPYIFDRFYRTDSSRNSSKGGSGIGLSIVRKILEDHGGKVWATSREGTGTVMHFVLRKYQEAAE